MGPSLYDTIRMNMFAAKNIGIIAFIDQNCMRGYMVERLKDGLHAKLLVFDADDNCRIKTISDRRIRKNIISVAFAAKHFMSL